MISFNLHIPEIEKFPIENRQAIFEDCANSSRAMRFRKAIGPILLAAFAACFFVVMYFALPLKAAIPIYVVYGVSLFWLTARIQSKIIRQELLKRIAAIPSDKSDESHQRKSAIRASNTAEPNLPGFDELPIGRREAIVNEAKNSPRFRRFRSLAGPICTASCAACILPSLYFRIPLQVAVPINVICVAGILWAAFRIQTRILREEVSERISREANRTQNEVTKD